MRAEAQSERRRQYQPIAGLLILVENPRSSTSCGVVP